MICDAFKWLILDIDQYSSGNIDSSRNDLIFIAESLSYFKTKKVSPILQKYGDVLDMHQMFSKRSRFLKKCVELRDAYPYPLPIITNVEKFQFQIPIDYEGVSDLLFGVDINWLKQMNEGDHYTTDKTLGQLGYAILRSPIFR